MVELKDLKRNLPLLIICDASKDEMGSVLQQKSEQGWETTHFAARFLTEFEQKHSINELERLAVVWAIDKCQNYVYGTEFDVVSDHKALTTILRDKKANKTFSPD